ncbi:universal stress protein [Carboxylicivirga linearis]|uniref:Universal stress protein n=1 Tax=Carboxylicivirga linearis TaxID=1628157 RepID=A0ABS5JV97_9BACT|nr:universal stress protein [Carboxylicivirga linearis]MBS2098735.1 universal stress protein [Carboxylicivirga linearis]
MVRIYVPVNFSEYSVNAINYAMTLAQKLEVDITLLHCSHAYHDDDSEKLDDTQIRNHFDVLLKKYQPQLTSNVRMHTRHVKGYPEDVLVELSVSDDPDVIVMGTRSKGETIKELLGSVTSDVIKNAKVPVLAVPAESTIDLNKISHVLFVTDFGEQDYRSLHKLIKLVTPFNTVIHAVHFATNMPDRWDKKRLEEMRLYCAETYRKYKMEFEFITGDDFIDSLDDYIKSKETDLIAMTRRKRNMISKIFHPSITRKILFHTDVPLLVFHE